MTAVDPADVRPRSAPHSPRQRDWLERAWAALDRERLAYLITELVNIPSPTGSEGACARRAVEAMRQGGLDASYQQISPSRGNAVGRLHGDGEVPGAAGGDVARPAGGSSRHAASRRRSWHSRSESQQKCHSERSSAVFSSSFAPANEPRHAADDGHVVRDLPGMAQPPARLRARAPGTNYRLPATGPLGAAKEVVVPAAVTA